MLGPSTALYRHFLKHCTLTNKAVGTIWRTLSKPPQRRQCPDLCPLWLLVGTPSAITPELASRRAEHSLSYSDVIIYIFTIYLSSMFYVYRFSLPLRLGWLLVCCPYKEVYLQIFKSVSFWLHGCCGSGKVGPVNQVNHTSWVAVVSPADRPKSVRNRCVIELFCGVVYVTLCPFDISVGVGPFVIGLSQITSFFLWLTRRLGLYDGTCQNILIGDRFLILNPSDCYLVFLQPLYLTSLQDGRSTAYANGCPRFRWLPVGPMSL